MAADRPLGWPLPAVGTGQQPSMAGPMQAGSVHRWTVQLGQGDYVRIVVQERGPIDIAAIVLDGLGDEITRADTAIQGKGEQLSWRAARAGQHHLDVHIVSIADDATYEVEVERNRPALPLDDVRLTGDHAFAAAYARAESGEAARIEAGLTLYQRAADHWDRAGEICDAALAYNRVGLTAMKLVRLDDAEAAYRHANTRWSSCRAANGNAFDGQMATQLNLGDVYRERNQFDQAFVHYDWVRTVVLGLFEQHRTDALARHRAEVEQRRAEAYRRSGQVNRAAALLEETITFIEGREDAQPLLAHLLVSLGTCRRMQGQLAHAETVYREAARLAGGLPAVTRDTLQAAINNNMGILNLLQGEASEAEERFEAVLAYNQRTGNPARAALAHQNLGRLRARTQRMTDSGWHFDRAIEHFHQMGDRAAELETRVDRAWVFLNSNDPDAAVEALEATRRHVGNAADDPLLHARVHHALGYASLVRQEPLRAIEHLDQAVVAWSNRDRVAEAQALTLLGEAHLRAGHFTQARTSLESAFRRSDAGLPATAARIQHLLALVAEQEGRRDVARVHFEAAWQRNEALRSSEETPEMRAAFAPRRRDFYESYIDFLLMPSIKTDREISAEDQGRAFALSEAAHARSLVDILHERAVDVVRAQGSDDGRRLANLRRLIRVEQARLDGSLLDATEPASKDTVTRRKTRDRLRQLERERGDVLSAMAEREPTMAEFDQPRIPSLADTQAWLAKRSGTLLVSYLLGRDRGWIFTVSDRRSVILPLPVGAEAISAQVGTLRKAIEGPGVVGHVEPFARAARDLYQHLLAPVAQAFPDADRYIIVPDRSLHHVPFETLLTDEPPSELDWRRLPYTILRRTITYGHSAGVLMNLDRPRPRPAATSARLPRLVGFGAPSAAIMPVSGDTTFVELKGAANAIEHVVEHRPGARGYAREDATEARFKSGSLVRPGGRVLLITHGDLSGTPQHQPRLVLGRTPQAPNSETGSQAEDGFLELHEIFALDLPVNLLVLAGCETNMGELLPGEGLMSMTRAFFYSGVRQVIASLWKIDDQPTHDVMVTLFAALDQTDQAAVALRTAKMKLIEGPAASPYYWAGFELLGQPTTQETQESTNPRQSL